MTQSQMQRLQETIEKNTEAVEKLSQELAIHNVKQEEFERKVIKHEIVLYGTEERKGIIQRFDIIEDKVLTAYGGFSKAAWIAVGVVVSAAAIWVWQTFIAGLIP